MAGGGDIEYDIACLQLEVRAGGPSAPWRFWFASAVSVAVLHGGEGWYMIGTDDTVDAWLARHNLNRTRFPTRRERLRILEATDAHDPAPPRLNQKWYRASGVSALGGTASR